MARSAEAAERYEDMCKFMKDLVEWCAEQNLPLTTEERNLLSVAFKNVIGTRRSSWRTLNQEQESNAPQDLVTAYRSKVNDELQSTCKEVLNLLENNLLGQTSDDLEKGEAKVFYLKMTGDYYRYLAESSGEGNKQKAEEFYDKAYVLASKKLNPTHPIRLGLALNFSVCYYEILKEKEKACNLAKEAFDEAISKLDALDEADYKDSTLIMQLLRDNLTLWTSTNDDEDVTVEDLAD